MTDKANANQKAIQDDKKQVSSTEYKKIRAKATQHLMEEIKFLKVEAEYNKYLADIEEHKTRKMTMVRQQAIMYNEMQQQSESKESKPERKLKKD